MEEIIDLLDKKILTELDKDSRQPNNRLSKKLGISRERLEYRIKQLQKKGVINKFPTIINPTKFGYSMHKLYFQFQNLPAEKEKELSNWLIKNPYVQWVTNCKGKWDMNIIVFAHNVEHFNEIMQKFYDLYGDYIFNQQFNITLSVGNMEKTWILPQKNHKSKVIYTANERGDSHLDSLDLGILKIIANNSRMPLIDIADKLKTTPQTVKSRIKILEKKEVIKGYTVSLDYNILKKQFYKVIFYINVITENLKKKLTDYCLGRYDMPFFVFSVGEWPFEVEYVVDSIQQFYDALEDIKRKFPQIKRYESILLSKEHKFDFMPLCYEPQDKIKNKSL